jgi:hypothetical protein
MTNNKQQTEINAVEYLGKVKQFARENNPDKPKQQTAIEWLFDNVYMAHSKLSEKLKQAKAMEKEQIINAVKYGYKKDNYTPNFKEQQELFEQYYEETYGGNK